MSEPAPPGDVHSAALSDALTAPACGAGCDPSCVEPGRYVVNGDVVLDTRASRLWQRAAGARLSFGDASTYCRTLSRGSDTSDWRLPTMAELGILLFHPGHLHAGSRGTCTPAVDQAAFPATLTEHYWTSDALEGDRPGARALNFLDGRSHDYPADQELAVRCVREP